MYKETETGEKAAAGKLGTRIKSVGGGVQKKLPYPADWSKSKNTRTVKSKGVMKGGK